MGIASTILKAAYQADILVNKIKSNETVKDVSNKATTLFSDTYGKASELIKDVENSSAGDTLCKILDTTKQYGKDICSHLSSPSLFTITNKDLILDSPYVVDECTNELEKLNINFDELDKLFDEDKCDVIHMEKPSPCRSFIADYSNIYLSSLIMVNGIRTYIKKENYVNDENESTTYTFIDSSKYENVKLKMISDASGHVSRMGYNIEEYTDESKTKIFFRITFNSVSYTFDFNELKYINKYAYLLQNVNKLNETLLTELITNKTCLKFDIIDDKLILK